MRLSRARNLLCLALCMGLGHGVSACAKILGIERESPGSEFSGGSTGLGGNGLGGQAGTAAGRDGGPDGSGNTELAELEVSHGELSPPFESTRRDYTLRLPLSVAELEVTARASDPKATISVDTERASSGQASHTIPIPLGVFELVVSVESSEGAKDSYRILVERALELGAPGYLKASLPRAGDHFGHGVALSGLTLAIGAPDHDGGSTGTEPAPGAPDAEDSGAVYLFLRSKEVWEQVSLLKAGNTDAGDGFGHSVAISGDRLVVGAPFEDSAATRVDGDQHDNSAHDSGAAYVFRRSAHGWLQEAYLKAHNAEAGDHFGLSVALEGSRIVVGAPREDSPEIGTDGNGDRNDKGESGAVYVFEHDGMRWRQHAYVKASNTGEGDRFGHSVALSGTTFSVGAPYEDSTARGIGGKQNDDDTSAMDSGAAYIFVLEPNAGVWKQQAYVKAATTQRSTHFGWSVALSGDTFAGSAPFEGSKATGIDGDPDDTSAAESGAVYVYTRDTTGWAKPVYLKASNTEAGDQFGWSVALFGEFLAVGARGEDGASRGLQGNQFDNRESGAGALYLFARVDGLWAPSQYVKASNTGEQDTFGHSVALSDRFIAVGASYEDGDAEGGEPEEDSGAVYVLDVVSGDPAGPHQGNGEPSPEPTLDSGLLDETSLSEAASGSVAHFGIHLALSDDTLAVGTPDPVEGGKVHVFEREGSDWRKQSTLTAEEGLTAFGSSVALTRDTLAVGAGNAVTIHARALGSWSLETMLGDPHPRQDSLFGASVALADDTLVVGDPSALSLDNGEMIGAVYVFTRAAGIWSEALRLEASNAGKDDAFGASVALFGDTLVVGAPWEDSGAAGIDGDRRENGSFDSGAVYVFQRSGSSFVERSYIKAHNSDWHDEFGSSVALFGNLLVVGAPYEDGNAVGVGGDAYNNRAENSGAVYAFELENGNVYPDGYVKALNSDSNDHFGYRVALAGELLAVSALNEDGGSRLLDQGWADNGAESSGAVHLFQRSEKRWLEKGYVKASNASAGQLFGFEVALSDRSLAVATQYGEIFLREVFAP